jgi:protein-disulfide isomerase-like protein with CxxC motif
MEPQWRRLRYEFGERFSWRYRMGGMIADWRSYADPVNSISRPAQMGPVWMQVRHMSGMPLDDRLWIDDPPESSYPACLAFKAAELQSPRAAESYLRRLREAAMLQRRNIARGDVLLEIAEELAAETPEDFDAVRFASDLDSPAAQEAFRDDLKLARYLEIGRFPALVLRLPGDPRALLLVGYRPYAILRAALERLAPQIRPVRKLGDRAEYQAYWGNVLERELAEAMQSAPSPFA